MLSRLPCRGGFAALALVSCLFTACNRTAQPEAAPSNSQKMPPTLWKEFSGEKAFEHVRAQVNFGPRPSGSASLEKARQHIISAMKEAGWEVERQEFQASPVLGKGALTFVNLIARFPGAAKDAQRVILGSHYDTKRMPGITFVGANDGGSSTGALVEFARVVAQRPELAKQMELVFFDGEEAIENFGDAETGTDGLVGSRHYARDLRASGRAKQFRYAVVWDMIGDKELKLTLPADSPADLAGGILTASEQLGLRKHIGFYGQSILDDHMPIARIAKIRAIDLIDFDYGPGNTIWHTSNDTLDQISPDSLRIVGQLTLWLLERDFSQ